MSIKLVIYLFVNFAKRPGSEHRASSITKSRRKKKRKLVIQLSRMTLLWKRQKKKCQCKNRIGEDIDKKSTTHTIEQAVQWPTSVALNTHTLKGLGGFDIVNRLISGIQVVIKKIFLEVRYLKCATGITKLSLT